MYISISQIYDQTLIHKGTGTRYPTNHDFASCDGCHSCVIVLVVLHAFNDGTLELWTVQRRHVDNAGDRSSSTCCSCDFWGFWGSQ